MYLLECSANLKPVLAIVGWVVFGLQMAIPIALIVLGMIDMGKAVIASKEDEIKKAKKAFGQRFLYAVAVFLVVWAVRTIMSFVPSLFGDDALNTTEWNDCWACITTRGEPTGKCKYK